jgi:hypothetical protein
VVWYYFSLVASKKVHDYVVEEKKIEDLNNFRFSVGTCSIIAGTTHVPCTSSTINKCGTDCPKI